MMKNPIFEMKQRVTELVSAAMESAMQTGTLPRAGLMPFVVEIPADLSHGDFASNAAMVHARAFKKAPRAIAQAICDAIKLEGTGLKTVEIAGPGFLNFTIDSGWFADVVLSVLDAGADYGRSDYGGGKSVQVEFVSANPTGPMHMGNARGGALGDCLAAALDWAGYRVTREFYVNDAGNQIEKFAVSLDARYRQHFLGEQAVEFPQDGYQGDDIKEHAAAYAELHGDALMKEDESTRKKALVDYALPLNIEKLRYDLGRYRINYDVWFMESTLHPDAVNAVLDKLRERGWLYERDGALWYKATENGAEKDEVLVRANGFPTYFSADIAYHYNKLVTRGFDKVINVWGADHHGHVARLKGAMDALGIDSSRLDIVLMQLVRLMRDGQPYKMSKRTGKAISLTDLLEEIPVDAARFWFNMREPNSTIDFDLDLAAKTSSENPVYYVQYAHARICSILRKLESENVLPRGCTRDELTLLCAGEETSLIRLLARFPQEIVEAAKNYDPARLTKYAIDTATGFHKFYNACRVKGEQQALMQARLNLCIATKQVLGNALELLKITVPETM